MTTKLVPSPCDVLETVGFLGAAPPGPTSPGAVLTMPALLQLHQASGTLLVWGPGVDGASLAK